MINRPPQNTFAYRVPIPQVPPSKTDHTAAIRYNETLRIGTNNYRSYFELGGRLASNQ